MRNIDEYNFAGKKALVRVDFNVPLDENYNITDDNRIRAAVPTINKILSDGGAVILMSHLGRPKNGPEEKFSLKHLVPRLSEEFGTTVLFANDCVGVEAAKLAQDLQPGQILLLENLRFHKAEEKGDPDFAKDLAAIADVYVNDAFGTAHREHASTAVVARYFPNDKMMGYVMQSELTNARRVLENVERPYTAIMGGAKISDKILIIERLMDKVDNLIIGGGMSYTFVKADGGEIGSSLVEMDKLDLAARLIGMAREKGVQLMIPVDSVIADAFSNDANVDTCLSHHIPPMWMGLDIGPNARETYADVIRGSKTILWNGPMGVFEMSNFSVGTEAVAEAVVDATRMGGYSLIGGGDSAAAVNQLGYADRVSYVSTGGGALLEYMEGKTLPGVAAIERDDY
ncbi:phosphoglycerate kinase [Pontibacter harenae]|uniref:phosphoglycerate kinase n=1 Tax=Pontibacter harenae TaxID=2894083 RepID=UPI001E3390EC|nr:phosphoglycerate kinase [Pontibacter harenae]MCC9165720.1 phosphoglycerate kinase [Pontibacter harenae]